MKCVCCNNGIFTLDGMQSIVVEDYQEQWAVIMGYYNSNFSVILYKNPDKSNCQFVLQQIIAQLKDGKDVIEVLDFKEVEHLCRATR